MAHNDSPGPITAIPSVLIVGANGFLGRTMPPLIATRHPNCKIYLLDITPETSLGYPYFRGDITDLPSLIEIFQKVKPAVVIHSASPPIPTIGKGDPALFFRVNVEGTRNIINACNKTGVRVLIYTSSASVIYDGGNLVNANEKTPFATRHVDPYNASKMEADKLVLESNSSTLLTCTLRPSGIFGPGDRTVIPGLYDVIRNGQTAFQVGDNLNLWDFTYVDNVVHAHILAAENLLTPTENLKSGSAAGETFLITNGQPVYFWDFARGVWAGFGHVNPRKIYIPMSLGYWAGLGSACHFAKGLTYSSEIAATLFRKRAGFTRFRVMTVCCTRYFDIRKAKRVLGYEPIVDLNDGVTRACKAYTEAGHYMAIAPARS